jgi:IstB-like ATP binding protein
LDKEGWPAARLLSALAELEIAERGRRRIERHLAEARLPPGKTLDNFDFATVLMLSKARVMALAAGVHLVSLTRTDVAHEPHEGLGRSGFVERLRWFVIDAPAGILFII